MLDTQLVNRKGRVEEMEKRGEERREGREEKLPQNSWVVLLLKHAGLPPNDHPVPVWLLLHVGRVAGPMEGEEEGAVGHVVGLQLEETVVHHESIDCGLDPRHLGGREGGGGGGGEGGRERGKRGREGEGGRREGGRGKEREGGGGRERGGGGRV